MAPESNEGTDDEYDAQMERYYDELNENVRKVIADSINTSGVELPDDARRSLELDIICLVDGYVQGASGRDWEPEAESLSADECALAGGRLRHGRVGICGLMV